MMIQEEIFAALDAGFPELEGRIYPLIMPQDTKHNCLTYTVVSESDETCLEGNVYDTKPHVQVDAWAHTYKESVEMANKIDTVIRDAFTISGLFKVELYEQYTLKYRKIVDFRIL